MGKFEPGDIVRYSTEDIDSITLVIVSEYKDTFGIAECYKIRYLRSTGSAKVMRLSAYIFSLFLYPEELDSYTKIN